MDTKDNLIDAGYTSIESALDFKVATVKVKDTILGKPQKHLFFSGSATEGGGYCFVSLKN